MIEELNFVCLPNETSYGLVATNLLKSLTKLGVRVNLFPIHFQGMSAAEEDRPLISKCLENARTFNFQAPSVRLWHQFALDLYPGNGLRAAFPIFELNRFNEVELHHLKNQECILVCSNWAIRVLSENEIYNPNAFVVPLGVDRSIFNEYSANTTSKTTKFFMTGKKELRKGHDFIKRCFNSAFTQNDDVELHLFWANPILKQSNPKMDNDWNDYYRNCSLYDKIFMYDWVPTQNNLAELISKLDCGLFVSRAEGWNLGLLEAFSMGKHCIVTDYSAHTEFATNENSRLVPITELETAYDGVWFHGQGRWAKIGKEQEESIVEHMRQIHKNKQDGILSVNQEGIKTAEKFSWENSAKELLRAVDY